VVGAGRELEELAGLSVTVASLPDVGLTPIYLEPPDALEPLEPDEWQKRLDLIPEQQPCFLLLPDAFSVSAEALIEGLDGAFPGCAKVGGVASGAQGPGQGVLLLNDQVLNEGLVGLALWGDIVVETVVAQGCRPLGETMKVTRSHANLLLELDGEPALDALDEIYRGLEPEDRLRFRSSPLLGIGRDSRREHYRAGDFLVRNLLGVDRERSVIAVSALVEEGQTVQFHLRDARSSSEELHHMLGRQVMDGVFPSGALMFSCLGRGLRFYGIADHDSRVFCSHYEGVPLAGFFCNGEIGPVHGETFLHGYTSSFGLFHARGWS
jgi:small ligand-binding sensory domain FIST